MSDVESLTEFPDIEHNSESEYEDYEEKRVKVFRKKNLPEIEPEYNSDTSDDEYHNTVGNIPMEWYDDFPHIGYDINGEKIMKPAQGDDLDKFLSSLDDKNAWKSVYDKLEGKDIVLSKEELEMLKRIQQKQFPDAEFDPYEPTIEWFSGKTEIMPLSAAPEPKRRFIPSKMEASKIMKIAKAIRAGLIVPGQKKVKKELPPVYDIWSATDENQGRINQIQAPKMDLPGHMESYNPPEEYILTPEEEKEWLELDPEDRTHKFLPKKHQFLRQVGSYPRFIHERFERCLDLYLCPRTVKQKLDIDPESLIPKLPDPKDLKPFPTKLSITYKGHIGRVRCFTVDPLGQWIASGSDDCTVRIWEVSSGRNMKTFKMESPVMSIGWNPNKTLSMLAVSTGNTVILLNPSVANELQQDTTKEIISDSINVIASDALNVWEKPTSKESEMGHYLKLKLQKTVTSIVWHRRGDYFVTVAPDANSSAVQIHQLSKAKTQTPFKKLKGIVQKAIFHPSRPILFTQRSIRVYNLVKQELLRKMLPGAKWISSIDIHPGGDNVIVGSYDKRTYWFDMDLSAKPYKTIRNHTAAVRQVQFHSRYPLFASSSDDGTVMLFHGMVYNDFMQNPLIVPLKTLKAHDVVDSLGSLDCQWHPYQPWIFTCGADKTIKLFV